MNLEDVIKLLESNMFSNIADIKEILLRVADNILKHPESPTYKTLKKTNALVSKKILAMKGGKEVLLLMGFTENSAHFVFPVGEYHINHLKKVREDLGNWEPIYSNPMLDMNMAGPSTPRATLPEDQELIAKPIAMPPLVHKFANPFLRRVTETFHQALVYRNKQLKENAKKRIPIATLERNAQKKMRELQVAVKQHKSEDLIISMQDLVLVELLKWFKEDFFLWVDAPDCEICGGKTSFSYINTDEKLMIYTKRIEMYHCPLCKHLTPFPRYTDLNILLETRRGRCGEWAHVFTLMCHSMGWDARIAYDETDHVWTEVYSMLQNRWMHCDPCDNVCDTPLMYEHGWKKPLTYVMSYSPEELQDVTWRYSSNHKEVLRRRKGCTEHELVSAIIELRKERLQSLPPARQMYILKRTAAELAELMIERNPNDDEMRGRTSGSLDWRIARGEIEDDKWSPMILTLFDTQLINLKYRLRYCCASDRYDSMGESTAFFDRWNRGVVEHIDMMRKVEKDWKQVYLCRKEGTEEGYIAWKIVLRDTTKRISTVYLKLESQTFENGKVSVEITSDDYEFALSLPPENELTTSEFRGSRDLLIEARLSGGIGTHAWQHAQLFRQSDDSTDYPFELLITFE